MTAELRLFSPTTIGAINVSNRIAFRPTLLNTHRAATFMRSSTTNLTFPIWSISMSGHPVAARVRPDIRPAPGALVMLRLDLKRAHLFDAATGRAVGQISH